MAVIGDVIGVAHIIFLVKNGSKVVVNHNVNSMFNYLLFWRSILMSQNFKSMKLNIVSVNPILVATLF